MRFFFEFFYFRVVREIARSVDLNTLDALSRTCRQFHLNLIPYRQQLAKQTLRCENEYVETVADLLQNGVAIPDSVKSVLRLLSQGSVESGRLTRGKVAKCARDMVGECRKCSKVVCRVCYGSCGIWFLYSLLIYNRTARSSLPQTPCSKTAFVDYARPVAPSRFPTTWHLFLPRILPTPSRIHTHENLHPRLLTPPASPRQPFYAPHAPATKPSGYATSAATPCAPTTRPIAGYGPGARDTVHT